MNWFRQNRFLGTFLIVFGLLTLAALYFVWSAKSGFTEAQARFDENAAELNRLQRLTPLPNEANLKKMKAQAEDYATALNKLKEELKTRVLPVVPMAPNEFQARLRQAVTSLGEKARANRVKLPENFNLGFDEFVAALPDTAATPLLGQQLAQAEFLVNIMLDARIEALTVFHRITASEALAATPAPGAAAGRKPAPSSGPQLIERTVVEASFISSPGAARRVMNQVASVNQQFFVIRTIHVLDDKEKGPPREVVAAAGESTPAGNAASPGGTPAAAANSALNFIVGTERVQASAQIEMLRFTF